MNKQVMPPEPLCFGRWSVGTLCDWSTCKHYDACWSRSLHRLLEMRRELPRAIARLHTRKLEELHDRLLAESQKSYPDLLLETMLFLFLSSHRTHSSRMKKRGGANLFWQVDAARSIT